MDEMMKYSQQRHPRCVMFCIIADMVQLLKHHCKVKYYCSSAHDLHCFLRPKNSGFVPEIYIFFWGVRREVILDKKKAGTMRAVNIVKQLRSTPVTYAGSDRMCYSYHLATYPTLVWCSPAMLVQ